MKALVIDIETAPAEAYVWSLFDSSPIPVERLKRRRSVLCFAAKWLGEKGTWFYSIWDDGEDAVAEAARDLFEAADVIISYNGKKFDIPRLQGEIVLRPELELPSPFKQIDLYPVVRRQFGFDSNRLAFVAPLLGLEAKGQTGGFSTWIGCMEGDPKAQKRMEKYNRQDVKLTEQLYDRLLPWIPSHPNRNVLDGGRGCVKCGSPKLHRHGTYTTNASKFQRFKCQDCGSTATRSSKRIDSTDLVPIAGA